MQDPPDWRSAPRNVFSIEFKLRMVELVQLPGANIASIAREHGFNHNGVLRRNPGFFRYLSFQPGDQRIQVNNLIAALGGIMSVQQNILPCYRGFPVESLNTFGIAFRFQSFQQSRQDRRVVINDGIGNQPPALIAYV